MRKYQSEEEQKLEQVICNQCGKTLRIEDGYLKEGCFHVDYVFGYFSNQDGMRHSWDLCEECYDAYIKQLKIPPQICEQNEIL